jgi:hypothetical protein
MPVLYSKKATKQRSSREQGRSAMRRTTRTTRTTQRILALAMASWWRLIAAGHEVRRA